MKKYIGFTLGLLLMFSPVYGSTEQQISLLQQLIALLEQEVQLLMIQLQNVQSNATTTPSIPINIVVPIIQPVQTTVVGNVPVQLSNNQTTMDTEPILDCTLSVDINVGAPSSYVNITWTSNADSGTMTNSHISAIYNLEPVSGATKKYQLSSESGENNIFTAHFILKEQTKDCIVSVMTQ